MCVRECVWARVCLCACASVYVRVYGRKVCIYRLIMVIAGIGLGHRAVIVQDIIESNQGIIM